MSNPSKQKGTAFETDVVRYLNLYFEGVERRTLMGSHDQGDIAGVPLFTIEAKNQKRMTLSEWVDEAEVERVNANTPFSAVIHKRIRKATSEAYVTMPLHQWAVLVERMWNGTD